MIGHQQFNSIELGDRFQTNLKSHCSFLFEFIQVERTTSCWKKNFPAFLLM